MKVREIKNVEHFYKMIDQCKGTVELITTDGDRLNLKSKLSKYVGLARMFASEEIPEIDIVAYEREDIERIANYMMYENL